MHAAHGAIDEPAAVSLPGAVRKRLLVIYNPTAGARRRRHLDRVVQRLLALGAEVELAPTQCAGDGQRIAREACEQFAAGAGPDAVVAAGGDGTINEVVNGMAGGSLPLALLPIGTANVLAAEIGLDREPDCVARAILQGTVAEVYLGVANGRHFTLMAGVGIDADVVESVNLPLKRMTGKFAYAYATARRWLGYRGRLFRIRIDGVEHQAASAVIANGRFYAGRFLCARDADITKPRLHVCLFEKPGRWPALCYMAALFGGFLPRLKTFRVIEAREVTVLDVGGPVQGDGDVIARLPVEIRVADGTVPLVMPVAAAG